MRSLSSNATYLPGNITATPMRQLITSPRQVRFRQDKLSARFGSSANS